MAEYRFIQKRGNGVIVGSLWFYGFRWAVPFCTVAVHAGNREWRLLRPSLDVSDTPIAL